MEDLIADELATAQPGAWLTIDAAADEFGVNKRTIQRWITSGKLLKRTVGRGVVEVWVSGVPLSGDTPESTPHAPQGPSESGLAVVEWQATILARLTERQAELAQQQLAPLVAALERQSQELTRQAEELGRLRASEQALRAELERRRRPWWQRFLSY